MCFVEGADDALMADAGEQMLQDPFSYEELNMALMTASKFKGYFQALYPPLSFFC